MNIATAAFQFETRIDLPPDEVHLWRIDLAGVAPAEQRWQPLLSSDEQARALRFHFERDRRRFTATRAILRTILGAYTNSDPSTLVFRYAEKEKPFLVQRESDHVEFNVSHSGTVALLAFARRRELGVDLELIRGDRDHDAIARRFFSDHEQHELFALPPNDRTHAFFRCWTRKEAYIKAQGSGLSLPLRQFDVSLKTDLENALVATRPDAAEALRWSLRDLSVGEGYAAALCVQGHGWRLRSGASRP